MNKNNYRSESAYNYDLKRIECIRKLKEILGGKCKECGYCKNVAALDFHHNNPNEKQLPVGTFINNHKFSDAENEAKKCILLCKNCHAEHHNPRLEIKIVNNKIEFLDKELNNAPKNCEICKNYSAGKKYCSKRCSQLGSRKASRPNKKTLTKQIKESNFSAIGREYGVSDNAVRKWAKSYGII